MEEVVKDFPENEADDDRARNDTQILQRKSPGSGCEPAGRERDQQRNLQRRIEHGDARDRARIAYVTSIAANAAALPIARTHVDDAMRGCGTATTIALPMTTASAPTIRTNQ